RTSAGGNPGGGGGDSDSSSDDSDYQRMSRDEKRAYKKGKKEYERKEERRLQREKIEKLKLSGFKTKLPSSYDGTADYDRQQNGIFLRGLRSPHIGLRRLKFPTKLAERET
ncbi:hypothetical protein BDV93DRAFT_561782, partial [Ceratobasidium sp. AG-I]